MGIVSKLCAYGALPADMVYATVLPDISLTNYPCRFAVLDWMFLFALRISTDFVVLIAP